MSDPEPPPDTTARRAVDAVFRRESGRVLATLIRTLGNFDVAEEALQDALAVALERWPTEGVPDNPAAWITTAARRRAIDKLRRTATWAAKEAVLAYEPRMPAPRPDDDRPEIDDDQLRLIFTCCHPALAPDAQVALTLRTLCGLQTPEIAKAFLVPAPTLAQRIVRAKRKITQAGIPYVVPGPDTLPQRLSAVLSVIYLVFNEGYAASHGDALVRRELCAEAIRLARLLDELLPNQPEVLGLLALMLLHDSRRDARTDADGHLVVLDHQDRTRWDRAQIAEGTRLVRRALGLRTPGPYQIQAAIAAIHAEAPSPDRTDWAQIAALYAELARRTPSPVIELNRAVAIAMAEGPESGLALIDSLADELSEYHLLHAARADLLRRAERRDEAAASYRRALALAANDTERHYLSSRLEEVTR